MYGKQYWRYPDILIQSFKQINNHYLHKTNSDPHNRIVEFLKQTYVRLWGIPEIGFQIRSIYFSKILQNNLITKKVMSVLDAGCGIGAYTLLLADKFPKAYITGGDIDQSKLHISSKLIKVLQYKNIHFSHIDITRIHKKRTYDLIITIDVLEHIKNYHKVLKNFSVQLKKRGFLYIHVPQPNQKRLFPQLQTWHHEDHQHEGIDNKLLQMQLKALGFRILVCRETYGFYGKLAWELNHIMLLKSFVLAGITFPFLYLVALLDEHMVNKDGLGVAILAQKK